MDEDRFLQEFRRFKSFLKMPYKLNRKRARGSFKRDDPEDLRESLGRRQARPEQVPPGVRRQARRGYGVQRVQIHGPMLA